MPSISVVITSPSRRKRPCVAPMPSGVPVKMMSPVTRVVIRLATTVVVPAGTMPFTLPAGGAVLVRPDRYVAAVAHDAAELVAASGALLGALRASRAA